MQFEPVRKHIEFERTEATLRAFRSTGHVVSLKDVKRIVGSDISSERIQFHIIRTMQEDHQAGRPFLASIIVMKNQLPPEEYFQTAQQLGYNVNNRQQFWSQQLQQLGVMNTQGQNQSGYDYDNSYDTSQVGNRNQGQDQSQNRNHSGQNLRATLSEINSWYASGSGTSGGTGRSNQGQSHGPNGNGKKKKNKQGQQSRQQSQGQQGQQNNVQGQPGQYESLSN